MPIYEYECQQCKKVSEALQKFSDPPLIECPYCHGSLRKKISHSSFHLKGSGWYVTDYARKGDSAAVGKKDKSAESPEKGSDSSSNSSACSSASGTSESK